MQTTEATNQFYAVRNSDFVYPVEFVVRALMGNYPNLKIDKSTYPGSRILDLGYGDGRNMQLLYNLGFDVYGVEISDEINKLAETRLRKLGVEAVLKEGRNASIPFHDGFFQYLLACHVCYYIDEDTTFETNLDEITRVMQKDGVFIGSVPFNDTYILRDAEPLGAPGASRAHTSGYYRITNDPYGYRKGTVFRAFESEEEVRKTFAPYFYDICVGYCDDNFFGVHQKVWTVVGKKK